MAKQKDGTNVAFHSKLFLKQLPNSALPLHHPFSTPPPRRHEPKASGM